MKYHLTSVTMAVIKKTEKTHVGEYLEKREPLCTVGGNVNWGSLFGKQYRKSLKTKQKVKVEPI